MKFRYGWTILVSILAIQAGYGANGNKIPTFDEVIGDANVVIRPIQKELSIKIGNDSYLINAQGNLTAPNADKNNVRVNMIDDDQFDISILEGLVNLRCKTKNDNDESDPLWDVILYNTNYDQKLAIQADYVNTFDVAAKNLVTSARKNYIQNCGHLVSDHLRELSKCIDLSCQYEGDYSINSNKFRQKNDVENSLKEIWRFNQNFYQQGFDEQGNPQRSGFYCYKDAKINTNSGHVKIVDLESQVSGRVNVNRWISNKEVRFNINPQLENANQPQIQINYLDAPNALVNVSVEQDEQNKWLGKNDNGFVYFIVNQSVSPIFSTNKNNIEEENIEDENAQEKNIDSAYIKENIDSVYLNEDSTSIILPAVLRSVILNIVRRVHGDNLGLDGWERRFDNITLVVKNESYGDMNVVIQKAPTSDGTTENNGLFKCALFNHQGQICDEELTRQIWNNSIQRLSQSKKDEVFKSIRDEVSEEDLKQCHEHLLMRQMDIEFDGISDMLNEPDASHFVNAVVAADPSAQQIIKHLQEKDCDATYMSTEETLLLDFLNECFKLNSDGNQEEESSEELDLRWLIADIMDAPNK